MYGMDISSVSKFSELIIIVDNTLISVPINFEESRAHATSFNSATCGDVC